MAVTLWDGAPVTWDGEQAGWGEATAIVWDGTPATWDGQQVRWGESTAVVGSGEWPLPGVAGFGSGAVLVDGSGEAALAVIEAEGAGVGFDVGGAVIFWDGVPVTWDGQQARWGGEPAVDGSGEAIIPPLTA